LEDLAGKVAVVTGAASGIGLALAQRFADEGMKVVLADMNDAGLEAAVDGLKAAGKEAIGVRTDCGDRDAVQALRDRTFEAFGTAHVVCNNAGLGGGGRLTSGDANVEGWRRTMDVDLFGLIYGIEAFLPRMQEQGEGHIVNTASRQGLVVERGAGAYQCAKHAAVVLSEGLHDELEAMGSPVGVSVLCPGGVRTGMLRPPESLPEGTSPEFRQLISERYEAAALPEEVADLVVRAIRQRRLFVLTHAETIPWMQQRLERIAADMEALGALR
jgi:NAD(P)-dependent dehydrogenase (short-subunit alcohol dehydrogenase family)